MTRRNSLFLLLRNLVKMSRDLIILAPNGRRQKVHCTPDTLMLQVLEDVCAKQGFQAIEYALKHHNHLLDLTTTVRFSNLPNKATLEMVEAERIREETNVTIGLLLDDGDRKTADFSPQTCLYDIVTNLAPAELKKLHNPTIMYMRQEVIGVSALKAKTLRQLGLLGGRAILRLLNKQEEARQANISAVYRRPDKVEQNVEATKPVQPEINQIPNLAPQSEPSEEPGPSKDQKKLAGPVNPLQLIREAKKTTTENKLNETVSTKEKSGDIIIKSEDNMEIDAPVVKETASKDFLLNQEELERRLNIEEEVTFLGAQKAVAFMQPTEEDAELADLPDDFYELTIEEVRKLYRDLQQQRIELENTPLLTTAQRDTIEVQTSQQKLASYKSVVVRVQFPDGMILQGIFAPDNTIDDVNNFIRQHVNEPNRPFHIFTTPLKEQLDPKMTLLEARFVPCVHMHFRWLHETSSQICLKQEVYAKRTSSDAASILASKYRAPSRRKLEESPETSKKSKKTENSSSSKLPKWFKR